MDPEGPLLLPHHPIPAPKGLNLEAERYECEVMGSGCCPRAEQQPHGQACSAHGVSWWVLAKGRTPRQPPPIYPHHFLGCRSPHSTSTFLPITTTKAGEENPQLPQLLPQCCSGEVVSVQPQPLTNPFLPTKPSPAKLSSSARLSTRPSPPRTRLNQLREYCVLLREGQALGKHTEPQLPLTPNYSAQKLPCDFFFNYILSR